MDLRPYLVKILLPNTEDVKGTGFFVHRQGYILTCYHVIKPYLDIDETHVGIYYDNKPYKAQICKECCNKNADTAILKIEEILPKHWLPLVDDCKYWNRYWNIGDKILSYGYPTGYYQKEGTYVAGEINGGPQKINDIEAGFQFTSPAISLVTEGFSGAPVYHMGSKQVIGLIHAIHKLEDGCILGYFVPVDRKIFNCLQADKEKRIAGRKNEIKEFERVLEDKNCYGLWLHGPGGIGKTELIIEFCRIAKNKGYEIKKGAIGKQEGATAPFCRIFNIKTEEFQQSPEKRDTKFEILAKISKQLSDSNKDIIIAIDQATEEFDAYKELVELIRFLITEIKLLENRVFLLVATRKEPRPFPISEIKVFKRLKGLTVKEIEELIEIKGWNKELKKSASLLYECIGGIPGVLVSICRKPDAVTFIQKKLPKGNINPDDKEEIYTTLDNAFWKDLDKEVQHFLKILSIIADASPRASSP